MTRLIYWRISPRTRATATQHLGLHSHQRVASFDISRRYASTSIGETPLSVTESKQLQAFIHELGSASLAAELNEEHVVRALEVIRPMVRPLRKERKSAKSKTGKATNAKTINVGHEHGAQSKVPPSSSRQMTTQLHSSATIPRLGCPIPLSLEKSHVDALRGFISASDREQQGNKDGPSKGLPMVNSLSTMSRESLLRAQETLYDILLVRSTLTYWLHFAKVQWKKGQRKELVERISKLRNVARDQLVLGVSGKVSKPIIDNGLERYTLFKYRSHYVEHTIPHSPLLSWETLFEGLSSAKQGYQRELYEAKANIISYTLSRANGNELAWLPKPRSTVEKSDMIVKEREGVPESTKATVVKPIRDSSVAAGAFFTPSYSVRTVPKRDSRTSVKDKSDSAVDQSTGVKATLLGHRVPLEQQLQTNLIWAKPPLSSTKSLRVAKMTPFTCPPKIEWVNPSHEVKQKEAGKMMEKELYERFLGFVSDELSTSRQFETLDAQPLANFKTYSEIFAVRSGIGKDSLLATAIWRWYWDNQEALLISTDGSSKSDDIASVGVHFGTSTPIEFKGALPREWAAHGSYTAEWFAICYALWLSLDLQSPSQHLPNISARKTLVFCTDSSGIVTSITKPMRLSEKDALATSKSWTPLVLLCRQMIARLAEEGKDVKFTWMPRLSTVGLTRAHELADDVYGKISSPSAKAAKEKRGSKQPTEANSSMSYRLLGWFCL